MESARFSAVIEPSTNKLWSCHFVVPVEVAAAFLEACSQRVVCTLNDSHTWQCALVAYSKGIRVITLNKKSKEALGLQFGDTVTAVIQPDTSEYGLPIPEEFEALLAQDEEGNRWFQALTDGKKRTLLYIVAKPKSIDIRIRYSIIILNHLKLNRGKIDYKILNEELKTA